MNRPSSPSPWILLVAIASLSLLTGCDQTVDAESSESATSPEPAPTDPLSEKIEAFTGGHTKLAWARYTGSSSDVFGNFDKLELWGIDTRDGLGVRPILSEEANYARPLILPDGSGIIYSNKQTTRKSSGKKAFKPLVYRVDWNGENLTELGQGYAVDVWRDPETDQDWVYVSDLQPTERSSIEGTRLERFALDSPGKRELIWDKTRIGTENVHLSRDGKRTSCLFPWPDAGVLNLETMKHQKYQHGCWPSMAPDDSYHAWVFDGAHKNLFMFTDGASENWNVPINTAPGTDGHEMYHPRWSNHVRFLTMTGPYTGQTVTRSKSEKVEVYVGKFSADLRQVEDWLQVTDDKSGDLFPDLWIADGELANVEKGGTAEPTAQDDSTWPVGDAKRLFVWKNRETANLIDPAGTRESSVEAKEQARFGPHYEMQCDGGFFTMDEDSANAVGSLAVGPFTLELVAHPMEEKQTGLVIATDSGRLMQADDQWIFSHETPDGGILLSLGKVSPGKSSHLAITFDGSTYLAYRDGKPVDNGDGKVPKLGALLPDALPFKEVATPSFGYGWSGTIEGAAVSALAASPENVAASHAYWDGVLAERQPIATVRLRGKLIEMTEDRPVEALDTYPRALLGYLYEVEEVIEGEFEGDRVMVMHWTILERKLLSGFPRQVGQSYELTLQPSASHPQLISERQWNDLFDPSDPYYDIATPAE